jgi:ABC-type antimicrobial peptide transport system permease subunit
MKAVRDVFRRKGRTLLTAFGIGIGVVALVVMGSLAEKIDVVAQGGIDYYSDKVLVMDDAAMGTISTEVMSTETLERIASIDEVDSVRGQLMMPLGKELSGMGLPSMMIGVEPEASGVKADAVTIADGRDLAPDDRGMVVLGSQLARLLIAEPGDTVELLGDGFEVAGVMEQTLGMPDQYARVPMADAQRLFVASLPQALQDSVDPDTVMTSAIAYPVEGVDADALAASLDEELTGMDALGPTEITEQMEHETQLISANVAGEANGTVLFLLTPRLVGGAVAFSVALAMIAGVYPALHAPRLRPVVAFAR